MVCLGFSLAYHDHFLHTPCHRGQIRKKNRRGYLVKIMCNTFYHINMVNILFKLNQITVCQMCTKHKHLATEIYSNDSRYTGVAMSAMASHIIGISSVFSTVCSCAHHRKHQSSASLAFLRGIDRWPMDSSHKRPVTRKCFPLMTSLWTKSQQPPKAG